MDMDSALEAIWLSILDSADEFMPSEVSERWLSTCTPVSCEGGRLLLSVPSQFARDMVDSKIRGPLAEWLRSGSVASSVELVVDESTMPEPESVQPERDRYAEAAVRSRLNPNYIFDTFVVGDSNNLAHAASENVSRNPGSVYNPLFIWGGVGLGKTHLMQAIGHYVLRTRERARVLYATCEEFTNDMIEMIRGSSSRPNAAAEFRDKYRNLDVLLIDDIQFLERKTETQEAFYNTFNSLRENGSQIVLTSDRPPQEIKDVEARLVSRFQQGLVADIKMPNFETRIAILRKKAELKGYRVPDEVISYIAENMPSNIRELEGTLHRVVLNAMINGEPMNSDNIAIWLRDIIKGGPKGNLSVDTIQQVTAESFNVTVDDLIGDKRTKDLVLARQIAMYLCRSLLDDSLKVIGRSFGDRDHSTVIHACNKVEEYIKSDSKIRSTVDNLRAKL